MFPVGNDDASPSGSGQRTVTEQVLGRLRNLLTTGALPPGSRIDQVELARKFGVSIVPIREALARLQSAGLVEILPHRGVFVAEVSAEELIDIYTVRETLEEQAARIAVHRLTEADLCALDALEARMLQAANKRDHDRLLQLNRELHFTIYRAAGRRHMLQVIERMWDLSARYAHLQLHAVPDRGTEAMTEVRAIVTACHRRDPEAVGLMVRYKLHQTTTGLLEHVHLLVSHPAADARAATAIPIRNGSPRGKGASPSRKARHGSRSGPR